MKKLAFTLMASLVLSPLVSFGQDVITTVAGTGVPYYNGDGIPATSANVFAPGYVTVDVAGNVYVADYPSRVRRVDAVTGIITTVAGNGVAGFSGDGGPATSASFNQIGGLAVDSAGNLYISDYYNNRVRRVDAVTGIITTVAGGGGYIPWPDVGDGGPATSARVDNPAGLAFDGAGNLFICNAYVHRIRRVDAATGIITTVAGDGTAGYGGDGVPAVSTSLAAPKDIALDALGNLYIADTGNLRIRRVDAATGIITTIAGNGVYSFSGDGGPATSASLGPPYGIALDSAGNLFIADSSNHRIRRVDAATGIITTVAGNGGEGFSGDGGPATSASLALPLRVVADAAGNLFIADSRNNRIRRVSFPEPPVCAPAPAGMLAWWPGNGNADDIIGGRNGSLINGAGFSAGKVGDAFAVDGSNYIEVNDDDVWTLGGNAFTIDLWVNFNGLSGRDPFIAHDEAGGPSSKWIFWYDAQGHREPFGPALRLHVYVLGEGNYDPVVFPWTPVTGRWYHVAVTREGQVFKLYVDGNLVMTEESAVIIPDPATTLTIGKAEGFNLNGRLDEVEIFNRALSAEEIHAIFAAGSAGKCLNSSPVANAGPDQTVACGSPSSTPTTLDGSASSDPDGDTLTYTWTGPFPEGNGTTTGVSPTVTLPLGASTITLTVDDGNGGTSSDTVTVFVGVGVEGLLPPLASLVLEGQFVPVPDRAFKQGSTLPLKLRMYCGATALTDVDVAPPLLAALSRFGEAIPLTTIDPDAGEANDNGLRFRYSEPNWIYNLSTKDLVAGTYVLVVELPDGRRYNASFVLR